MQRALSNRQLYERSLSININLYWGLVMLVFGLIMLVLGRRGSKQTASTGSLVNSFQYTGRESDPETGLYYYRARYYDPNAGRFLSEDPLGFEAGINKYVYVENRPIIPNTSSNLRHGPHGDAEETSAAEQRHCNNERRLALAAASFLGAFRGH